ncbi:MAG: PfkB family carbohydrate kinase [Trueperaceae bacterium]
MCQRSFYDAGTWRQTMPALYLCEVTKLFLDYGVVVAGVKLGEEGLYVQTAQRERLEKTALAKLLDVGVWTYQEVWSPIFRVNVEGTVSAGDAAIAGFLNSILKGLALEAAMTMACAVGACCVEASDASSGILSWQDTEVRVKAGWARAFTAELPHWQRLANGSYMKTH